MRLAFTALLAALLLAFVACDDEAAEPTPSPTPDFEEVAAGLVPDVPLTLTDLPAGFERSTDTEDLIAQLGLSAECDIFDDAVVFPDAAAAADGDGFEGGNGQLVLSFGAIYQTVAGAEAAVQNTRTLVDVCDDEFHDTVEQVAREEAARLGIDLGVFANIDVSIDELDLPVVGDSSVVYRLHVFVGVLGVGQTFTLDVQMLRQGRTVGVFTYAGFGGLNEGEEVTVGAALLENATAVEVRLPAE